MSCSYTDPSNSSNDQVRFLIGDTDCGDALISDEEIAWALTQGSVYEAAAICAEAIAATFSRLADKTVDDLSIKHSQKSNQYLELAKKLRNKGSFKNITPYAGGISVSDKDSQREDSDRVSPSFTKGLNDYQNPTTDPDDTKLDA